MIHQIYPHQDAALYEIEQTQNTGLDQILELVKTVETASILYNSRILLQFDLSTVSASIVAGTITSPKYYLVLSATEGSEIPIDYTLKAYPVSSSWTMGNGKYADYPITTTGVSWNNRRDSTGWATASSYTNNVTASWQSEEGGGNWYTGSGFEASQSYNYEVPDVRMDVTDIVNKWMSQSIENNGFIIKRSDADESSADELGSIKFFSTETHTIYVPKLQVCWDDSAFATGSLTALTSENPVVTTKHLKSEIKTNSKEKVRVFGRTKYPVRTFSTSSAFLTINYLPTSSYWSLRDTITNDTIIPYDNTYTKISCDSSGNYFNFWGSGIQPNRYYRFEFKIIRSGTEEYFMDQHHFKVVR